MEPTEQPEAQKAFRQGRAFENGLWRRAIVAGFEDAVSLTGGTGLVDRNDAWKYIRLRYVEICRKEGITTP